MAPERLPENAAGFFVAPDKRPGPARPRPRPSVSLIGSFRKHYGRVREIAEFLLTNGVAVPSPRVSTVLDTHAGYVRFECDPPTTEVPDHDIQAATLTRLLASDFVYVIAPDGYIGLDTCMEIGHLLQARVPLFSSEPLKNVTMPTGLGSVLSPAGLLALVTSSTPDERTGRRPAARAAGDRPWRAGWAAR